MKHLIIVLILVVQLIAWETTTHRAIDKTAIESKSVVNLKKFVESVNIKNEDYSKEVFEGYTNKKTGKPIKYLEYFQEDFSDDAMADWNQTFSSKVPSYQNLIEAGTMLEDAVWPGAWSSGYGRFLNHFADPQNGYKGFSLGEANALSWATGVARHYPGVNPYLQDSNQYDYMNALDYFKQGFTSSQKDERRRYQAKMLVSVGHILHLMNDMNVPAHTRDDAHPNGDAFSSEGRVQRVEGRGGLA